VQGFNKQGFKVKISNNLGVYKDSNLYPKNLLKNTYLKAVFSAIF
jgi:hypothetical protein